MDNQLSSHLNIDNDRPPVHRTVTDWMNLGLELGGESPAVVGPDGSVTFSELNIMSRCIAAYLSRNGVKVGDRVGLCMNRSVEMIVGLIGILRAGAAYVPFDPSYPAMRLQSMQEDACLSAVLLHEEYARLFPDIRLVIWERLAPTLVEEQSVAAPEVSPESLAYVIFTSGSTGRPKGIAMPHRALANLIEWQLERQSFRKRARVLQYSSISFDVSFQEIATTIASGGTLFLIGDEERKDPRRLLDRLIEYQIERLFLPYVAMRSMIEVSLMMDRYPQSLREVITAGEQLRVDDAVRTFFKRIGAQLDNQYGPSETHVITANLLEGDASEWPDLPSIGLPLRNCGTCILDEHMHPVDSGERGELYLAGRNLAQGYLERDDLTAQSFIPSPFDVPDRPVLYKTGDLASYETDGCINFLGRTDYQIKILGNRIEPGEINNAAVAHASIEHCVTHPFLGVNGVLQLAAYYTVRQGQEVSSDELKHHLADRLPSYMVPPFLVQIDEIPYTPSGKVDLKALPQPTIKNTLYGDSEIRYETVAESALAGIWKDVLGMENIPRSADFFELGGNSLLAVTLFLKVQQLFGKDLPLSTLVHASTLSDLARIIDCESGCSEESGHRALQLLQQGDDAEVPLFLVHGGKGNVLVFNNFVRHMPASLPVYAFQWPGWDGGRSVSSIPEMAREYVDELRQVLRGQRCRLGGNCIGGLIAIEMTRLLRNEGIELDDPLLVWDSPNIHAKSYRLREPWNDPDELANMESIRSTLKQKNVGEPEIEVEARPESLGDGVIGILQRIPYLRRLVQWSRPHLKLLPAYMARLTGKNIPVDLREQYCINSMLRAVRTYVCPVFPGDMLYFRSFSVLGRDIGVPGWWDDLYLGFEQLCSGRFEAHVIGCRHNAVVDAPCIATIVRKTYEQKPEPNEDMA